MLFQEERFGLFIHWGLYSIHAWQEQEQWRKRLQKEEYASLMKEFNPTEYDPRQWCEFARNAGIQYICFTAKHHDGFCMWDTQYTDYKITNTPFKRDVLKELAEACEEYDMKLSVYYSIPDWNYKHSVNFGGDHQLPKPNAGDEPEEEKYKEYIKNQMKELLTNYGKIEQLFWDIPPYNYDASLNEYVRSLQEGILINDRGYSEGDYQTPERNVPAGSEFKRKTEACQSIGETSWGYREDEDYYSSRYLMGCVDEIMCKGGNYLLNVGPMSDGRIPEFAVRKVRRLGDWYQRVKESYQNTHLLPLDNPNCTATCRENILYLHLPKTPVSSGLNLMPIQALPKKAVLLNTSECVEFAVEFIPTMFHPKKENRPYLHIKNIPVDDITDEILVIKLEFGDSGEFNPKLEDQR